MTTSGLMVGTQEPFHFHVTCVYVEACWSYAELRGGGSIYPEFGSGPCHHGGGRAVAGKALQQKAEKAQVVPQPETPHPDFGGTWWDTSVGARTSRAESPMLSPALHEAVRDSNLPQEVLSGELNLKTKIRPLNWSLEGLA